MNKKKLTWANVLTLGNLVCGVLAILLAAKQIYFAAFLVFLGFFFDIFDGFVARKTNTTSDFGRELDSLADIVSFGVAPAVIVFILVPSTLALLGAVIFVAAAAWRLARHNLLKGKDFMGLPAPAAALILLCFLFLLVKIVLFSSPLVFFIIELALAALMVSTFKLPKVTA